MSFEEIGTDFVTRYTSGMVPRIISLIDMDAFFAQVCHVEYKIPRDRPLAVIHNQTVLAVNYPSRKRGVSRGMSKEEILSVCPDIIIPQNVFLDMRGALLEEQFEENGDEGLSRQVIEDEESYQKLSLDIFRKASRMIFSKLKSYLPSCRFQIASIDEIYFDLTDLVKKVFDFIKKSKVSSNFDDSDLNQLSLEMCRSNNSLKLNETKIKGSGNGHPDFHDYVMMLFPELFETITMQEVLNILYPEEKETVIEGTDYCYLNDNGDTKGGKIGMNDYKLGGIRNVTFQEMCLIMGTVIIYRVRKRLEKETSYTCSSGIFMNKIYSKMVCSLNKPNGQSVLLQRWFESYIKDTHILKLRLLGGKLGKSLIERYPEMKCIKDLQKLTLNQLICDFGERIGLYLFNSSRGIDHDPVGNNDRETNHSLQSSKIFSVPLSSLDQIENWLKIFSCELFHRNQSNYKNLRRKPTKITVKLRAKNGPVKARTCDFLYNSDLPSKSNIFESAKNVIRHKFNPRALFPCKLLGISLCGYIKSANQKSKISKTAIVSHSTYSFDQASHKDSLNACSNPLTNDSKPNGTEYLNDYFLLDLPLINALDTEIFNDDLIQYNDTSPNVKSETRHHSEEGIKYIYKDWPFIIQPRNSTRKKPKDFVQVEKASSDNTPSCWSSSKLFQNKRPNPIQTKYKQTKLEFNSSSLQAKYLSIFN